MLYLIDLVSQEPVLQPWFIEGKENYRSAL